MANQYAKNNNSRRYFLSSLASVSGLTFLPGSFVKKSDLIRPGSSELIQENTFPIYNVCNSGAIGDGVTLNTTIIQNVIDTCSKSGGGTVFFPPGNFVTGTFQIKSNVNIYLSAGATVWGSTDISDYKRGLIYAEDAKNISITGMGSINGNGKAFFGKFLNQGISEDEMRQKMRRPGNMMTFVRCNNILLKDITVENSPVWTIHPIDCERVTITGISILNGVYEEDGPNTDGINPDGCSKVRISDCYLRCGDDCIVIKVTNRQGGNKICRDIVVTNCVLQSSETALKIGTETYGEFRNITFSNCVIHDSAGGIGLHMRDGGLIDGMVVSNITVDCDRKRSQGIFIWSFRRTDNTPWGMIRNVIISDMTITGGGGIFISGVKEKHIEGLTLENIRINIIEGRNTKSQDDPPYPFEVCGNEEAPYDIFCRYVDDLKIRNVQLIWSNPENAKWGSALRCWHIRDLEIAGFVGRQSLTSKSPAIWLKDVKGAFIHNCRAPEGTGTFLQLDEGTGRVTIIGNELSQSKELYKAGSGVDAKEIFETANRLPG
jgi:hypothetical protein